MNPSEPASSLAAACWPQINRKVGQNQKTRKQFVDQRVKVLLGNPTVFTTYHIREDLNRW